MKELLDTARRSFPKQYANGTGVGAWDLGFTGLIVPASVTLIESLAHDVAGIEVPHGVTVFFGTLVGCIISVWFARRFRPQ